MKITALLAAAGTCLATSEALSTTHPYLSYTNVTLFDECTNPMTISEKSGLTYKPHLNIDNGQCYPYPAVQANGSISKGLNKAGDFCGKLEKSQVYGRAEWYGGYYAIMYCWFIPAYKTTHWPCVVTWVDNPAAKNPQLVAVATTTKDGYEYQRPVHEGKREGSHVKVSYIHGGLFSRSADGDFQSLIMWSQLTDEAKRALNNQNNFYKIQAPFNDHQFSVNLGMALPEKERKPTP